MESKNIRQLLENLKISTNSLNVATNNDDFKTNFTDDELKNRISKLKSPQQSGDSSYIGNFKPLTEHDRDVQLNNLELFKAEYKDVKAEDLTKLTDLN